MSPPVDECRERGGCLDTVWLHIGDQAKWVMSGHTLRLNKETRYVHSNSTVCMSDSVFSPLLPVYLITAVSH